MLPHIHHFQFTGLNQYRILEAFSRLESGTKATYAGVQAGPWLRDEAVWSEIYGRYGGTKAVNFFRGTPNGLTLVDGAVEAFGEIDTLVRVPSGGAVVALCGQQYQDATISEFCLYNCANIGSASSVAPAISGSYRTNFGAMPDGSYLLWARLGDNLTTVPTGGTPGEVILHAAIKAAVLASGLPETELCWGEWAAIRVQVGAEAWTTAAGVLPSPGAALYRKTGDALVVLTAQNEAACRVDFDPLARTVSASCVLDEPVRLSDGTFDLPSGTTVIAGLRASTNGPQSALWALHQDHSARLLAVSENFSDGLCECGKADHHASDVGQNAAGDILLLSECSLFKYNPKASSIKTRLEDYPRSSSGHPGGQCLRFFKGETTHLSENLTAAVDDGIALYNRLVRRVGGRDLRGPGTLCHCSNATEVYQGQQFAIRASEAINEAPNETAKGYLDTFVGGRWSGYVGNARPLAQTFWQRLCKCGSKLYLFGHSGLGATPTAHAVSKGALTSVSLPYFVRRATRCDTGQERLLLCARPASQGIGVARHVVEIGIEPGQGGEIHNAEEALAAMPDGSKFRVIVLDVPTSTDPFTSIQVTDTSDGHRFTVERETYQTLWARFDSDAPLSDLASYRTRLNYDERFDLEKDAKHRVQVVLLVSPENLPFRANELPVLQRRN